MPKVTSNYYALLFAGSLLLLCGALGFIISLFLGAVTLWLVFFSKEPLIGVFGAFAGMPLVGLFISSLLTAGFGEGFIALREMALNSRVFTEGDPEPHFS